MGKEIEQPLGGANLQRLAQGRSRNPEQVAQLALRNAGTVAQVSLDNIIPQAGEDFIMQRSAGRTCSVGPMGRPRFKASVVIPVPYSARRFSSIPPVLNT